MKIQSKTRLFVILKYPPLTFLVIGKLEMENLCRYPLMTGKWKLRLLGLHYKHTVQIMRLATIGEGLPCPLILSFVPCSSIYKPFIYNCFVVTPFNCMYWDY